MYTVFEKVGCPHCARARKHLRKHGVSFKSVRCSDVEDLEKKIKARGFRVPSVLTFPRVFDGKKLVGGADNTEKKFP